MTTSFLFALLGHFYGDVGVSRSHLRYIANMAKKDESTRIQMTFPTALVEKIDELCERLSIPRTAWVMTTLAQAVESQHQAVDAGMRAISDTVARIAQEQAGKSEQK